MNTRTLGTAAIIFLVSACRGGNPTSPPPEALNTVAHSESGGGWNQLQVTMGAVSWRLLEFDSSGQLRGAYNIQLGNGNEGMIGFHFELRFFDSSGFQVDSYPRIFPISVTLAPNEVRQLTGNFTLSQVTTISSANSLTNMQVWGGCDYGC